MKLVDVVSAIKAIEPSIRALGVDSLYLFGSTARDEATPTSDVDVFVDWDPNRKLGLIEFTDLAELLEEVLGAKVDLGTRQSLHPALKGEIERAAVRIL